MPRKRKPNGGLGDRKPKKTHRRIVINPPQQVDPPINDTIVSDEVMISAVDQKSEK